MIVAMAPAYARAVVAGPKPNDLLAWERAWEDQYKLHYTELALAACDKGSAACASLLEDVGHAVEYHVDEFIYHTVKWLAAEAQPSPRPSSSSLPSPPLSPS